MNRFLALLLLLFIGYVSANAAEAIILIQHDKAGPNLPTPDFIHPTWILWPREDPEGSLSQLQSLTTGMDWSGNMKNLNFKRTGPTWLSTNYGDLQNQGYFKARSRIMGAIPTHIVTNPAAVVSYASLLLSLTEDSPKVTPLPFTKELPKHGLIVYEAVDWNDTFDIVKACHGRALIVEFPVPKGQTWTRCWLKGVDWPQGVPVDHETNVPGLIHARNAVRLLINPQTANWSADTAGAWGGPNRWLEHGDSISPILEFCLFTFTILVAAIALSLAANEDSGPIYSALIQLIILSPAILTLSGTLSHWAGLTSWPLWLLIATLCLGGFATAINWAFQRHLPEVHPLFVPCLIGLVTISLLDPVWSDMSGVFRTSQSDVSGESLGAWIAYLAGTCTLLRGGSHRRAWISRLIAVTALTVSVIGNVWWIMSHTSVLAIPAVCLLASEDLVRRQIVYICALLPSNWLPILKSGIAWNPNDLISNVANWGSYNLRHVVLFLISPAFLGTALTVFVMYLYGNKFIAYRMGRLLQTDPRRKAILWTAACTAAIGITDTVMLRASLTIAIGAGLMLLFDALRSPEPFLKSLR